MAKRVPLAHLNESNLNTVRSQQLKPGRKPKSIEAIVTTATQYEAPPPRKRRCVTLSKRQKLEIIYFLRKHRIAEPEVAIGLKDKRRCLPGLKWDGSSRPP